TRPSGGHSARAATATLRRFEPRCCTSEAAGVTAASALPAMSMLPVLPSTISRACVVRQWLLGGALGGAPIAQPALQLGLKFCASRLGRGPRLLLGHLATVEGVRRVLLQMLVALAGRLSEAGIRPLRPHHVGHHFTQRGETRMPGRRRLWRREAGCRR